MTIQEATFAVLEADSAFSALIGQALYPVALQTERALPYVIFTAEVSEENLAHDAGVVMSTAMVTLTCCGKTPASANAIMRAARAAMVALRGVVAASGSFQWMQVSVDSTQEDYISEVQAFTSTLNMRVMFQ